MKTFYATHRIDWHAWLKENHQKEAEVWLIYYKKATGEKCITYRESLEEAICFGWIDGLIKKLDEKRYVRRFTPRKKNSHWSKINKDLATRLIKENRMKAYGLQKIDEAKTNGKWNKAHDVSQKAVLPDDVKKALLTDPSAWKNFRRFTNSIQYRYIYWVNEAKRDATRQKRIFKLVEYARKNIKSSM